MSYSYGELDAGSGGVKVATDRISTKDYQIVKIATGGEGTATEIGDANPMPASVKDSALPTGAATSAKQDSLAALVGEVQASPTANTILDRLKTLATGLTNLLTELQGKADLGETQPVSGPLTDAQLRATAVPVSGTFYQATQPISAAALPLPSGAATSAAQTATQALIGEVQASPTSNTVLGRLKDLLTGIVLAAGSALIGKVAAGLDTSTIYNGATALTPAFAFLSTATSGSQQLIAADATKKARILALQLIATASTNAVYFTDGTANLYGDSTRKIPLDVTGAAGPGGLTLPFNPAGWFEGGAANRAISLNLGSANGVLCIATYILV